MLRRRRLSRPVATLAAGALLLGGCGAVAVRPAHLDRTADYRPGVAADLYLPPAGTASVRGSTPVVVLVPGGSWRTADRSGLAPLADTLAEAGMVVVLATYRAADDGVTFPVPVEDVACAVSWAAEQARQLGVTPDPLVVAGHSAGAQLAALAALAPAEFAGDCPADPAQVDGLVGLAGAYDVGSMAGVAHALFGVDRGTDPALWALGDTLARATERPDLRVLLVHGTADDVVPAAMSSRFSRALLAGGHDVAVSLVPDADHMAVVDADVAGPAMVAWVADWPPTS